MGKGIIPKKIMKGIRFYNVTDLSKILNITELSARVYLRKNIIQGVKVGRRWYIREKNLNDFLLCKNIRSLPDDKIIEMVNKAVEIKYEEWTNEAIPKMQKVVADYLLKKEKERDKEKEEFKEEMKLVYSIYDQLKKVLPEAVKKIEHKRYREKDLAKI